MDYQARTWYGCTMLTLLCEYPWDGWDGGNGGNGQKEKNRLERCRRSRELIHLVSCIYTGLGGQVLGRLALLWHGQSQ